jgi:glycosyltransferase XagB
MAAQGGNREGAYYAAPNGRPVGGGYWDAPTAERSLSQQGAQSGRHRMRPTPNASVFLSKGQLAVAVLLMGAIAIAGYARPRLTLTVAVACCMAFYTYTALLKLVITLAGRNYEPPRCPRLRPDGPPLPRYAVLLPVRNEANMLPRLVARVDRLVYPRRRLLILILIEHDDVETLTAARRLGIPPQSWSRRNGGYVRVLVVPPGGPRTKPNALNAAMETVIREGCEFVTVYDAEDRPHPEQLLRAVSTFRAADRQLACLQAELAFWNDDTNWITALYWVGYKIHFTRFLPGLARLGLPIPLGGTSNHFRVSALLDVALRPDGHIWDAYNLTEDADLGARLAAGGYRVGLLRSTTLEEAPVDIRVVDKQQRRWKAGYLQTGFVHLRQPLRSMRRMGPLRWLCFNSLVLGVPVGFLLNPLFIALTIAYFVTRAPLIMQLFPTNIYYLSLALMLLGNFGLLLELAHTCLTEADRSRGHFGLVRYMLLAQLMWLWMSRSTYIALLEMLTGRRGWHKTPHGHAERSDEPVASVGQYRGERPYSGYTSRQVPPLVPQRSGPPASRTPSRAADYSLYGGRR